MLKKYINIFTYIFSIFFITFSTSSEELNMREILEIIQKDLRTLERAVYSESFQKKTGGETSLTDKETEDVLTRHLLKLSEIEKQFQNLTNKFEEINFKVDKLSSRLSKTQADNQLRFQDLESNTNIVQKNQNSQDNLIINENTDTNLTSKKIMPGTSQPQDLGTISYKDMTDTNETQSIQSVETTQTILTESFINEEKILPNASPLEQYEFATSFLKVGDYNMAERAFREFVDTNPDNDLSGNAQYWYAETFRIRQLYTDAASAYLEGYQKYPKSEKAPINLLKLGVSLVQIGEKDQGCLMIAGVKKQYPNATQSVLQKAKYEEKKFECKKKTLNFYLTKLKDPKVQKIYKVFSNNLTSLDVSNKKIMVGVSGGADSLSVLFFSQCYALKNKAKLYPVIIDHKLRKESSIEAKNLKYKLKKNFKINCKILSKKNNKIDKNVQSYARDLRYDLFFKECVKYNIKYLLLGHHKDDLIENFFIRFLRGSGLKGLVSFEKKVNNYNGINIIRPFLSTSKKELININKKTFGFFIDDPSNKNDKFLRSRIRKMIRNLEEEGLNFNKLYRTIKNLSKSDEVIQFFVEKNVVENSKYFEKDEKIILNSSFFSNPDEIILRSFSQLILLLSKKKNYPRGKKVISVIDSLKFFKKNVKLTLSGCIIEKINDSVIIYPEK